ncbi:DUF2971 domain-containing protein [Legionella septentrionalis]|nr:DUF2971 domain-containing protein [Legionella septentrionalis]
MNMKSKQPDVLYHYTSHDILFNIVDTKSLIASHIYYLNDYHEIKYGMSHFVELLEKMKKQQAYRRCVYLFEYIQHWLEAMQADPPYIFSFSLSEKGNLLSQWRAYTPYGIGVSLGFKVADLECYAKANQLLLVKCIYKKDKQIEILKALFPKLLNLFDENKRDLTQASLRKPTSPRALHQIKNLLINTFIQIKDPLFYEECEWRIVSRLYEDYLSEDIKFRSSKTTLIPYILLDIASMRHDGQLFEHVYVGPSPNFDLLYPAIVAFLQNKKACNANITKSVVPYREI